MATLIDALGPPDNASALSEYANFIIHNEVTEETELYCEFHHIVPSCIKANDLVIKLTYNDHCHAHLLLFLAYNTNTFHRTLNFMKPKLNERTLDYKNSLKAARKEGWKKFKNSDKYQIYVETRKKQMTYRMQNGFASELSARRYTENPNARNEISKHFIAKWADPAYRERVMTSMINERQTPEAKIRLSLAAKRQHANKTNEERTSFSSKMSEINKCPIKRKDASAKIKEKWKDPEFRERMSTRKHGSNSNALKEKWKDPEFRERMLAARKQSKPNESK